MRKKVALAVLLIVAALAGWPYLKVEYLTFRYGDQFHGPPDKYDPGGKTELLRVFEYDPLRAKLLVITSGPDLLFGKGTCRSVLFYTFMRESKSAIWKADDGEVMWIEAVWTNCGSADDWVYYPHYGW